MSKLNDQQRIDIVNEYLNTNTNCGKLARKYGLDNSSIRSLLLRRNIQLKSASDACRKYSLNQNYFDIIDTEAKAYFLGLLYADGYNNEKRGEIHLSLQAKDKHILDTLAFELQSNQPLIFLDLSKRGNKRNQDCYRISLSSHHMSEQLHQKGCPQKKSFILEFPPNNIVPDHFINDFIRGYFDGDGSLILSKVKKGYIQYHLSIISTESFCNQLQEISHEVLNINTWQSTRYPDRLNTTRSFNITGNLQVSKFLKWIYQDASVYLDRKFQKYQSTLI